VADRVQLPGHETLLAEARFSSGVDGGRVTSPARAGTNVLRDTTKNWAQDVHRNRLVKIIGGAGAGQMAVVGGNTAQSLVIKQTWRVALDASSIYQVLDADLASEFASLKDALSRILEVSEDYGAAAGGSNNTVVDTSKNWAADMWQNAVVHVTHEGIEYVRLCSGNTADTLTITALPGGTNVAAGDDYVIKRASTIADVGQSLRSVLGQGSDISAANPLQTYDAFQKINLGDFTAQTNLQSLLQVLGVPDVADKPLYECLVTDRWDSRLSASRAARLDNLSGSEPAGTYQHPDGVGEEDAVVITPALLTEYRTLLLDLNELAQSTMIRAYLQVDGANYRLNDLAVYPADFPAGAKVVSFRLSPVSIKMKVTLQSVVGEGVVRNIPWRYVMQSLG